MSSVLAIDAGQTGIKLRLVDAAGSSREWGAPGIRTDLPLVPQLTRVLDDVVVRGDRVDLVGIGVSGLTEGAADARSLLGTAARLGTRSLTLAHDSITAYLGALGDARGAVVASGTGVVTLAVGEHDVARVDGWGNLLGDAGSGYWIGRAALDAVMRAHDGRGPATSLTGFVVAEFPSLEDAYIELQGDAGRVRRIAGYARAVAELAEVDPVAGRIAASAAGELAHSVVSALARVGEASSAEPQVRAVGGVFRSRPLADAFEQALRVRLPGARVLIGNADPLDGAARLPQVGAHSALHARLVRADAAAA